MDFKVLGKKNSGILMLSAIAFALSSSSAFTQDAGNSDIGRMILQTFNREINVIGSEVLPKEDQDQIIESRNYRKTSPIGISFSTEGADAPYDRAVLLLESKSVKELSKKYVFNCDEGKKLAPIGEASNFTDTFATEAFPYHVTLYRRSLFQNAAPSSLGVIQLEDIQLKEMQDGSLRVTEAIHFNFKGYNIDYSTRSGRFTSKFIAVTWGPDPIKLAMLQLVNRIGGYALPEKDQNEIIEHEGYIKSQPVRISFFENSYNGFLNYVVVVLQSESLINLSKKYVFEYKKGERLVPVDEAETFTDTFVQEAFPFNVTLYPVPSTPDQKPINLGQLTSDDIYHIRTEDGLLRSAEAIRFNLNGFFLRHTYQAMPKVFLPK